MAWLPTDRAAVVTDAVSLLEPPDNATVPRLLEPSVKVTVPSGMPAPGAFAATDAVNVTGWPQTDGPEPPPEFAEVKVVVVGSAFTVWTYWGLWVMLPPYEALWLVLA